jgi:hypothetical protein
VGAGEWLDREGVRVGAVDIMSSRSLSNQSVTVCAPFHDASLRRHLFLSFVLKFKIKSGRRV